MTRATRDRIIIANCGGFWGDDPTAAKRQVEGGPVDYLVMDYLAEITMAILQKQRQRNPTAGYATDFLSQLRDVLVPCAERGIRIITNAGGVNPLSCMEAVEQLARDLGVADKVRVGVVLGDDIYDDLGTILASGQALSHMDTGDPLSAIRDKVMSANIYLGAAPIVKALEMGANVVIAGRVTDTAVTLAPMIHEFGWADNDWDRLAAGIVAGHIIECGAQATGGNFTDWHTVKSFSNIGYPVVEACADGSFVVTKHPGTGGLVNIHTISEQLLYEMGTPQYIAPDCLARFDSIQLSDDGPDRVRVTGIRGEPAPDLLKVSVSFSHGYRIFGRLMVTGPDSLAKANKAAEIFWDAAGGPELYEEAMTQFIGWNATHPTLATEEPSEVLLQVAARDKDKGKLEKRFAPFVVGKGLSSMPGWCVPADQGRPRVSDVVGYWPALLARDQVRMRVRVGDQELPVSSVAPRGLPSVTPFSPASAPDASVATTGRTVSVPLMRLCLARSGDKGDTCNVGVIARSPAVYKWMLDTLTPEFVKRYFGDVCKGEVERFEVANIQSVNFLLHQSLGGGGTMSIQFDAQGKTYAQYLLAASVEVDEGLLETVQA